MAVRTSAALEATDDRTFNRKFTLVENRQWKMLDFFAGSGLVSCGLSGLFSTVWANDICAKKAAVYQANHKEKTFVLNDIKNIKGIDIPFAHLSWASFPCQDLSLAGAASGIHASRSGLVWQWLRIIDEMKSKPRVLIAENVAGLVSTKDGENYRILHNALCERGYKVGAVAVDAARFVPQSRPRIFVIAVSNKVHIPEELMDSRSNWMHSPAINKLSGEMKNWVWWSLQEPQPRTTSLMDIIEWDAPTDSPEAVERNLELMSLKHKERLFANPDEMLVGTGYKRTRHGKQVLEVRFDGTAGCLRTPDGGSSRQLLIVKKEGKISTRLLTVREAARLMGAPESFELPGKYNDGYRAMGDAVAVPVAEYLGKHLLVKLVEAAYV